MLFGFATVLSPLVSLGPNPDMCSGDDDEPGPPLNTNVTGRRARSLTSSRRYAMVTSAALGAPSRLSTCSSTTVAYGTRTPPNEPTCFVVATDRARVTSARGVGEAPHARHTESGTLRRRTHS
jgi:hypothetical protein